MNAEDGLSRELQTVLDFLSHCLSPVEQWQLHQIQAAQQTYFLPEVNARQPEKLLRCPAEGCGKVFRSSPGYRYHLKSHAQDPRPHQCQCCMKKFKSANGLKYHLRKAHDVEPVLNKAKGSTSSNEDSPEPIVESPVEERFIPSVFHKEFPPDMLCQEYLQRYNYPQERYPPFAHYSRGDLVRRLSPYREDDHCRVAPPREEYTSSSNCASSPPYRGYDVNRNTYHGSAYEQNYPSYNPDRYSPNKNAQRQFPGVSPVQYLPNHANDQQIPRSLAVKKEYIPNSCSSTVHNGFLEDVEEKPVVPECRKTEPVISEPNKIEPPAEPSTSNNDSVVTTKAETKCEEKHELTTDINGNSVPNPDLVPKRRSSKPIPPALVIQPPPSSNEEPKEPQPRLLHGVSRLTEFAEFATSPHSPLVQSPFPLSLTPGLLGDSTPDWILKSPRFFFPDKVPSYLMTPVPNRNHDDRPSSLPPSPFIDNVSTPLPFWSLQAWPTPVWHCFIKGTLVKFENKDMDFKKVEEFGSTNSLLNKRNDEVNYAASGLKVCDIEEVKSSSEQKGKDCVQITFASTDPSLPRLIAKCSVDHPFLVRHKGWSAPRPNEALSRYGIPFNSLQIGDICKQSVQHKDSNANTLSPLVSAAEAFTFNAVDTSAASTLSMMAKRQQEAALEKIYQTSVPTTTTAPPISMVSPIKHPPPLLPLATQQQSPTEELPFSSSAPKRRKRKKRENDMEEKERRPMNGFMLFAKRKRIELTQKFPGKDNRAISKVLGEQWRALGLEERQDFATRAKEMADERKKINPDCWKRKRKKNKDDITPNKDKAKKQKLSDPVGVTRETVITSSNMT